MTIPRCLVAGVDASPESLAALELALELVDRLGARLVVVHAVGLLEEGGYRPRPDLGAIVADARQRVGAGGAVVDLVYEDGPPPDVLLRVAEREAAELLVVGSRGVSGARRQLGSTSEAVVMSSRIPVLVVPRPAGGRRRTDFLPITVHGPGDQVHGGADRRRDGGRQPVTEAMVARLEADDHESTG